LYVGLAALFVVPFLALHGTYGYVIDLQSETNDCFFMFGRSFLLEFLDHPAGPLRYAGRFFAQFYHYRWLGALIVSAWITCFGVLFYGVLAKLKGTVPVAQVLLPCLLLLALHTSTICVVHDTVGLSVSCGAFLGYLSLRGSVPRRAYALAATPILYLVLGCYAWLFVAWVVAFEWLEGPLRSGLWFKIGYVAFSVAVPLVAWRWLFPISLPSAFVCPVMFGPPFRSGMLAETSAGWALDCVLAAVLCVSLLGIPFWGRLFSGTRAASFWRARPDKRKRLALAVAISLVAILLHVVRYNGQLATLAACRRAYRQRQWVALLEEAKGNPYGNLPIEFMTNFALWHKGTLLDEMFRYPHVWGTRGLVLHFSGRSVSNPAEDDTAMGMYNSDLFYEMGHVNAAFRHAYNALWAHGRTYEILKRMAECSMANGNDAMAAKYLNILERTLFHRDFARRYKAILADPGAVEREFRELRERLPTADGMMFGHPAVPLLTLLEAEPDNRMAFDYLTAWLLLDKKRSSLAAICANVEHFRTAGYASIPTHCQEAMLLMERAERTPVDLRGFRYDEGTTARVQGFLQGLSGLEDPEDAAKLVQARYGETYLFYYFFVDTPIEPQQLTGAGGGFGGTTRQE
jgi:hypothetical protein